jgi:hypothetical protein
LGAKGRFGLTLAAKTLRVFSSVVVSTRALIYLVSGSWVGVAPLTVNVGVTVVFGAIGSDARCVLALAVLDRLEVELGVTGRLARGLAEEALIAAASIRCGSARSGLDASVG